MHEIPEELKTTFAKAVALLTAVKDRSPFHFIAYCDQCKSPELFVAGTCGKCEHIWKPIEDYMPKE